jgi:hypothetical protein
MKMSIAQHFVILIVPAIYSWGISKVIEKNQTESLRDSLGKQRSARFKKL